MKPAFLFRLLHNFRDKDRAIHCRRYGVALDAKSDDRRGRPRECCSDCEPFRSRERYIRWRNGKISTVNIHQV
jgi:hypothetical protein